MKRPVEPELRVCSQFLEGAAPEGPFRLFHESLRDYLLDSRQNPQYAVDPAEMHGLIVESRRKGGDWKMADWGAQTSTTYATCPSMYTNWRRTRAGRNPCAI